MTNHTNGTNAGNGGHAPRRLTLTTPADAALYACHALGFVPADSLVLIGVGGRVPTSRVDFPHTNNEILEALPDLGEVYARHSSPGARVIVLAWTNDTTQARKVLPVVAAILADVAPVVLALQVHDGNQPAEAWTDHSDVLTEHPDLIGPWPTRAISTAERDRIAVEFVGLAGATPAASRSARAETLAHDPEATEATEAAMRATTRETTGVTTGGTGDGDPAEQAEAIRDLIATGSHGLTADTVARLALALDDRRVRDALVITIRRANAAQHRQVWTEVARRTPSTHRAAPLILVALTAWLAGDGAYGWIALDALDALDQPTEHDSRPDPLPEVVRTALTLGHHPDTWERAILGDPDTDPEAE